MTEVNSTPERAVKPNCYDCIHRGSVPGSAHSSCQHPATHDTQQSPFMQLAGAVGKRGGSQLIAMAQEFGEGPQRAANALQIRANFHGIKNGWFIWPVNFDPVWLENCDGFTPTKVPRESAQPCGCDPGEGYTCARHRGMDVAR